MKQLNKFLRENWRTDDRGAVLVEFALVLPLLFLLLLAAVEFGYAFRTHQILQNAVREAARYSVLPGNEVSSLNPNATEAAVKQRIIDYCQSAHLDPVVTAAQITINQHCPISYTAADGVTGVQGSLVTIDYTHNLLFGGAMLPIGNHLTLHASVVFRNMY
jgi:Flp pilus assembly protein TadG